MVKTLDRASGVPLHTQLRDLLKQEIVAGAYRPGAMFPTEREISERYHVSRSTIRGAVADLVRSGFLVRQQGKGTFVARARDAFDATELSSFTEDMRQRGFTAGATTLVFDRREPRPRERQHFGAEVDEVWCLLRLRTADGEPIALQESVLPAERFEIDPDALADGSLYEWLEVRYGTYVARADEVISAEVADPEQARRLGIAPGSALLCVERFAYSQTGEPMEVVTIQYRADRYRFFVLQNRGG